MNSLEFKKMRTEVGMTQGELSKILGVSKNTIWNYENGGKIPGSKISLILTVLNMYSTNNNSEMDVNKNNTESDVVVSEKETFKEFVIIPHDSAEELKDNYFDIKSISKLKIEVKEIPETQLKDSEWFKVEVLGASMDDVNGKAMASKHSLTQGEWAYCASIPKHYWRDMSLLNNSSIFCFFHNRLGVFFRKIKKQNIKTGELELYSLNRDKLEFPNININLSECSYVLCVTEVLTSFTTLLSGNGRDI